MISQRTQIAPADILSVPRPSFKPFLEAPFPHDKGAQCADLNHSSRAAPHSGFLC